MSHSMRSAALAAALSAACAASLPATASAISFVRLQCAVSPVTSGPALPPVPTHDVTLSFSNRSFTGSFSPYVARKPYVPYGLAISLRVHDAAASGKYMRAKIGHLDVGASGAATGALKFDGLGKDGLVTGNADGYGPVSILGVGIGQVLLPGITVPWHGRGPLELRVKEFRYGARFGASGDVTAPGDIATDTLCTPKPGAPDLVASIPALHTLAKPTITAVDDALADAGGQVKLSGTSVRGTHQVKVGDITVRVSIVSTVGDYGDGAVWFRAPALPAGTYPITVIRSDGATSTAGSIVYR